MSGNVAPSEERESGSCHALCKLPLLDGKGSSASQSLTTQVSFEHVEKLLHICREREAYLEALLYTAWGLLLRCFAGQDGVSFHVGRGECDSTDPKSVALTEHRSVFQMTFDANETLLAYIQKVQTDLKSSRQTQCSPSSITSDVHSSSIMPGCNSTVWIQERAHTRPTQDESMQKLQDPKFIEVSQLLMSLVLWYS